MTLRYGWSRRYGALALTAIGLSVLVGCTETVKPPTPSPPKLSAVAELAADDGALTSTQRDELHESAVRVSIARRFYNDAVRDTRALRRGRMPRLFHLAGRRELPQFFDIDDTVPEELGRS